ncbi:lipid kinase [Thermogymnomonas acidicola]|uniref:Lipid kinase n=1 Tax=Thermogymnomonas acidicola TaxID=399579 RepID=A0AA37F9U1_9ARCH|nr:diacylglycerol kinase family protein [Thermogymnomonas acidicola]GGM76185.1 lipid kinase [Thermogymnomonas acidicola]
MVEVPVIVNVTSGHGRYREALPAVRRELSPFSLSIFTTSSPGEATQVMERIAGEGHQTVVVVGGDGTVNSLLESAIAFDVCLVPFQAGTGSDLVRSFHWRAGRSVAEMIRDEEFRRIDVCEARYLEGTRLFVNIMEVGFGARVVSRVNRSGGGHGRLPFEIAVLGELPGLRAYELDLLYGEQVAHYRAIEVILANGRYFGGGMLSAPYADLTDGLVDVHVIGEMGRISLLARFRHLVDGSYVRMPGIASMRAERIEIKGKAPTEVDGENSLEAPVTVAVRRQALRVI